MTEFPIRETENKRFHLNEFGRAVGGKERDKQFVFVVKDRRTNEIARSEPVTAAELRIAERGRGDYDNNKFHQKDFFKRDDETGTPQPHSAIARRVPWAWLKYPLAS
jgi:hypothetical protein